MDLTNLTASELLEGYAKKSFSSEEVIRACLERIERYDPTLRAFIGPAGVGAVEQAVEIDQRRARGEPIGPLAGVPIALKDNLCVKGQRTTCASRILLNYRPPYNATVVEKLRAADAIILGKTNLDEFAMGSSTENSYFGPTRNPWNSEFTPGGSSGGSAAAVAARFTPLALGSDTGGSIRQPAALCGIAGFKPTYGRVSRYGLVAFASSLDQIGPFARSLADVARITQVIAGHDPNDSTSADLKIPDLSAALEGRPPAPRVGIVEDFMGAGNDPDVAAAMQEAIEVYKQAGATFHNVRLHHSKYGIAAYYVVATAECSSNLARYDGTIFGHRAADCTPRTDFERELPPLLRMMMASRAEGFGDEVKRRIMLGTFALSAGYADQYYNQALRVRRLIKNDFDAAFQSVDVIIGPTSPTPAFKLGERVSDPLAMYLSDIYTITANLAGIAAISIPCGISRDGLPIGLQLLAPAFAEERLLQIAHLFERATDWHAKRPPVSN